MLNTFRRIFLFDENSLNSFTSETLNPFGTNSTTQISLSFKNPSFFMLSLTFLFILIFIVVWMAPPRPSVGNSAGPSNPRGSSGPRDPDEERKARLRKQIRKAFVKLLQKYCDRYCRGMGFCGKYCSRGREVNLYRAADRIAQEDFAYKDSSADVAALTNLRNYITRYHVQSHRWGDDMNEHWLFPILRRSPDRDE